MTGASDGLGKQYALELASEGFNICLIARNEAKLEGVAQLIRDKTGVKTQIVVCDFSTLDS